MVKSYRGVEVDMDKLIQQQGTNMSIGNTSLNGHGDIVKQGKIVKSRSERLKEYLQNHPIKQEASVNLANDPSLNEIEKNIKENQIDEIKKPKPKIKEIKEESTSND